MFGVRACEGPVLFGRRPPANTYKVGTQNPALRNETGDRPRLMHVPDASSHLGDRSANLEP
jgi:hypothetical protein